MKRLDHNSTKNIEFEVVVFFHLLISKKQCDKHLQTGCLCAWFVFYAQFGFPSKSGPFGVSQVWLEKSHVQEFSQKTWLYWLKEKSLMHLAILWLEFFKIHFFFVFDQTIFSLFSNLKFFVFLYFWTYQVDFYYLGIDF